MKHTLLYTFLFINLMSFAQTKEDSLLNLLHKPETDVIRAKLYLELAQEHEHLDKQTALDYVQNGIKYAENLNNDSILANLYHTKALIFDFHKAWETALPSYNKAIKYYKLISDSVDIAKCYQNMGITEYYSGNFTKAIKHYKNAINHYSASKNTENIAGTYNNLALVYKAQGNYTEAIKVYLKSLKIKEQNENERGIAFTYHNIGVLFWEQENFNEALTYFNRAVPIYKKLENKKGLGAVYTNLGLIYKAKNDTALAMSYYNEAIDLLNDTKFIRALASVILNKAELIYMSGNLPEAEAQFLKSLKLCQEINYHTGIMVNKISLSRIYRQNGYEKKSLKFAVEAVELAKKSNSYKYMADAYLILSQNYKVMGKPNRAYEYLSKYHNIKDSLFTLEKNKQINEIKTKYETEKKEIKIHLLENKAKIQQLELEQKNKRILTISLFLIFSLLFLSIMAVLFLQKRKAYLALVEHNIELAKRDIEHEKKISTEKNQPVNNKKNVTKYSDSQLDEKQKQKLIKEIIIFIEEEKFFINPQFTINDFAKILKTNRYYVSQIINQCRLVKVSL